MSETVFRRESAVEYFKELVDGALANQGVAAGELTAFYVVQMLAGFIQRTAEDKAEEPLAIHLLRAIESGRRADLRQVGDCSLFISGFFSDSLRRKLVDIDYYISIGGDAYGALAQIETDCLSPVFAELSAKFVPFVDVLNEVSERTACT